MRLLRAVDRMVVTPELPRCFPGPENGFLPEVLCQDDQFETEVFPRKWHLRH